MQVLTIREVSSLVIDSLCDQARGQDVAVTCFYFDGAAQKEQSSTNVLGALLKQVVIGLEEVPGEIAQAYEEHKKFIGGRRLQHTDIVKMLQTTSSKKRTFICIDALDECMPGHRVKLLDSLNQILQKAPGTRIFLTGGSNIPPEIGRLLAGRVTSLSISLKRGAVTRYPHARLGEDIILDAINGLEAGPQKKIHENISQFLKRPHEESHLKPSADRYPLRPPSVSPDIDAIPRKRQKPCAMADGLGLEGTCSPALGRIEGQSNEKVRHSAATSLLISQPGLPLEATLCHDLAAGAGSRNLDIDSVPSIETLLNYHSSEVWLTLSILQEYFQAHSALSNTAHSTMAETCLGYANSQQEIHPPIPKTRLFSSIPLSTGRFTPKGSFQIERNFLHWDCSTTIITTYPL